MKFNILNAKQSVIEELIDSYISNDDLTSLSQFNDNGIEFLWVMVLLVFMVY